MNVIESAYMPEQMRRREPALFEMIAISSETGTGGEK